MKNKNILKIFLAVFIIGFSSCETFDLEQTEDPSVLDNSFLDPVFTFNYVQLQLPDFVNSANNFTQRVTRQMAMTGGNTYNNAFSQEEFDTNWTQAYLMLNAIKVMEPKATANNQTYILGASKIMRCYILMTLVDIYGDIPYSEALQGNNNLSPRFDSSEDVYEGVYDELNQAIVLMQDPSSDDATIAPRDLYYGNVEGQGNKNSWITLAKTLKLKMLYTARLNTKIGDLPIKSEVEALIAGDDLIDNTSEDFEFKYGTERDLPNSRHPLYNASYEFNAAPYIGNYFMWAVSREKQEPSAGYLDPRTNFYFYKQIASISGPAVNAQSVPCKFTIQRPEHYNDDEYNSFYVPSIEAAYCTTNNDVPGSAFLGRDHGDWSGIPADEPLRTLVGLYPAGGAIGTASIIVGTAGEKGALGQGIMPMILSSFVQFMKAELALTLQPAGIDARDSFLKGVNQSIDKVTNFLPGQTGAPSAASVAASKTAYLNFITSRYDSASEADKLQIVVKEYYIAAWGNGIEPYNNYRRTGYPDNFQPTIEPQSGAYFYTALYPGVSVNNNQNAPTNVRTRRVFWDKAGLDLH